MSIELAQRLVDLEAQVQRLERALLLLQKQLTDALADKTLRLKK